MEYDILCATEMKELTAKVRARIADGWKPQGGVAIRYAEWIEVDGLNNWELSFYQAIIKE